MYKIKYLFFLILLFCLTKNYISSVPTNTPTNNWAEETLEKLTLDEKIGQLFIPAKIISPENNTDIKPDMLLKIDKTPIEILIQEYHIGGILYLQKTTTPDMQAKLTQKYQNLSKIPLFITQDLEWGLSMRLKNVITFPHNMTLGAIQDNNLIYKLGKEIGRQCKLIGVNINFSPVVDINNNPQNPVINDRSFGENKKEVAQKTILFMSGLQDEGIIACAKHFPGHGDTNIDSHQDLPKLEHNLTRLQNTELYPFKKIINAGIKSVMTGHLEIPALEQEEHLPATLSHNIVTKLLKNTLGFDGLAITDALNMHGVLKHHRPGELELKALLAGNDLLLCPTDTPKAINYIKQAIKKDIITEKEIDKKVLKILQFKENIFKNETLNLNTPKESITPDLTSKLHTKYAYALKKKLYECAITLVQDQHTLIPVSKNSHKKISYLQIGTSPQEKVHSRLQKHLLNLKKYFISQNSDPKTLDTLFTKLKDTEMIIIGLYEMNKYIHKNYKLSQTTIQFLHELQDKHKNIILVLFGNPYSLQYFKNIPTIIMAYEDDPDAQIASAKIIVGELKPRGKLPIAAK